MRQIHLRVQASMIMKDTVIHMPQIEVIKLTIPLKIISMTQCAHFLILIIQVGWQVHMRAGPLVSSVG